MPVVLVDAAEGRRNKDLSRVWSYGCPYFKEGGCRAKCRKERHPATEEHGVIWIARQSSGVEHTGHSQRIIASENEGKRSHKQGTRRKVGLAEREILHSPSKTKMPFKKARKELRAKGITVDKDNNAAFQQAHRQAKAKHFEAESGFSITDKNKIGALIAFCELHDYETKKAEVGRFDWNDHTTYILPGWKIDVETQYIAYLASTDKLLRNMHLQAKSGAPSYLAVDCTHRLVSKGHACIVFGTMDLQQVFHKVAYGMLSSKSQGAHEHCFEMLIDAVNAQATREKLPGV